ncbi:Folylpolyglutamate synthase [Wickerhamomyces ciferrii]|uniref:Folylpolyglutamate synthase n=1 Tax=Wickerhamomyces ciferrii (strain ATCC 14091 / BCRC 22168 / CBS 111 / JCM 3599 / NBRC 0793 / NRRL Y-1031 F-60-10) TaxID=1206466 RepID=K0KL81_WICCF|nr:Folylpolyglutamate synthase [Wickerhamomyces ciferrii]CCH42947.1 Folylpolyglutamate synthase [Wickerhamomyces ciferrii]
MAMPEMLEWTRRIGYKASDFNKLNIIHVTGTKGKGSTCAFTQSILMQYQKEIPKIGLYTSPHLKSVRERIRINGQPIAEELFTKYFFEVWDSLSSSQSNETEFPHMGSDIKPMYFKYLTLLSFHVFMKEGVNTAIYEVGVGGEFDSTNIIEQPTAAGVSALGIDHTFMLGNTITEIAWNKGGIFKKGAKAFSVSQEADAMKVLEERATERNTELTVVDEDAVNGYKIGIPGTFQRQNAALAVALSTEHLKKLNIEVDDSKTSKGLETTFWPGRCQIIKEDKINWYIDGAHTKESVDASSGWFKSVTDPKRKRVLLFNQQTRDANALVTRLFDGVSPLKFDEVIFTTNVTWSSGKYSADLVSMNTSKDAVDKLEVQKELADEWAKLDPKSNRNVFHDIESSIKYIRSLEDQNLDVFVCGSLHLVGGFLVVLEGEDA